MFDYILAGCIIHIRSDLSSFLVLFLDEIK